MNNDRIYLSLAHMSGEEQKYIQEAFDTNWVVPLGPNVDGFEKDLENYLGEDKRIVALSAGTAAIHLGLIQLGVGCGDEVICQSFTFSASANPIMYLGAKPVFVDSEEETWNISPVYLEEAILDRIEKTGKKPKAIIAVHLYGMPAKLDEITAISEKYDIPLLEDAAEALGSEYKGRKCGTFGAFGVLSFNGNKIITTSGGGALVCSSEKEANKTKFLATQARDNAVYYQHTEIGYNYRMSNICAGVGRGQMTILQEHVDTRIAIHNKYKEELSKIPGITVFDSQSDDIKSNYWLTCITIDSTLTGYNWLQLKEKMDAANVEVRPLWKPLHLQPVFADCSYYGENISEKLFDRGLCLPSSPILSKDDLNRILNVFYTFER